MRLFKRPPRNLTKKQKKTLLSTSSSPDALQNIARMEFKVFTDYDFHIYQKDYLEFIQNSDSPFKDKLKKFLNNEKQNKHIGFYELYDLERNPIRQLLAGDFYSNSVSMFTIQDCCMKDLNSPEEVFKDFIHLKKVVFIYTK